MDVSKEICAKEDDNGQPLSAFIECNGMTEFTSLNPKYCRGGGGYKGRHGKVPKERMANRIMGVEVVCGTHINHKFLYHLGVRTNSISLS